jgi:hypothetical protein
MLDPYYSDSPRSIKKEGTPERVSLPLRRIGRWWPLVFVILGFALFGSQLRPEEPDRSAYG